jgi:hypothetical protein
MDVVFGRRSVEAAVLRPVLAAFVGTAVAEVMDAIQRGDI